MSLFQSDKNPAGGPEDYAFMGDVEAAMRDKGSPWAYRISWLTLVICVLFLAWSCTAKRNEVTRGKGQVIPSLGIQRIQSDNGGVITEILVRENQEVQAGEILAQISDLDIVPNYQDLVNQQVECEYSLKRLEAEEHGQELEYTAEELAAHPDVARDQMLLFTTRRNKFIGGNTELAANLEQKRSAVAESLARKDQFESTLQLLREQEVKVKPLFDRGIYPATEYMALRQRILAQEGELKGLAETITRTLSEVSEEEAKLEGRAHEWQSQIASEQNEYRRKLASITEQLASGTKKRESTALRAPVAGVVKRIILKEKAVAQRAETIMELLPTEDTLEVEAKFRPADRGYISAGMCSQIKVDAYESSVYGSLDAVLSSISPDTVEDSKGETWYIVKFRTKESSLRYNDENLEIKAGMTVVADVISGEKTVFDYLMKPILKYGQGRAGVNGTRSTLNGSGVSDGGHKEKNGGCF